MAQNQQTILPFTGIPAATPSSLRRSTAPSPEPPHNPSAPTNVPGVTVLVVYHRNGVDIGNGHFLIHTGGTYEQLEQDICGRVYFNHKLALKEKMLGKGGNLVFRGLSVVWEGGMERLRFGADLGEIVRIMYGNQERRKEEVRPFVDHFVADFEIEEDERAEGK